MHFRGERFLFLYTVPLTKIFLGATKFEDTKIFGATAHECTPVATGLVLASLLRQAGLLWIPDFWLDTL